MRYKIIIRYLLIGVITTLINYILFHCMITLIGEEKQLFIQFANAFSWFGCVTFAFIANKKYVFQDHNTRLFLQAVKFYGGRLLTLAIEAGLLFIICSYTNLGAHVAKILTMGFTLVSNYFWSKIFVFKNGQK